MKQNTHRKARDKKDKVTDMMNKVTTKKKGPSTIYTSLKAAIDTELPECGELLNIPRKLKQA